jgi:hypothetical protein
MFVQKPEAVEELNLEVKTGDISFCSLGDDNAEIAIVVDSLSPRGVIVISLSPRGEVSSVTDCRVRRGLENKMSRIKYITKSNIHYYRHAPRGKRRGGGG